MNAHGVVGPSENLQGARLFYFECALSTVNTSTHIAAAGIASGRSQRSTRPAAMSLLPMALADKLLLAIGTAREMLSTLGMPSVRIECEGWKLSVEALNIIATAPDGTLTTSYECLRRRVAATTPQISSSVPKRKHADAQPRSEDCARRSSRQRLAPLNFWLGERVIYEPGGSASGPRIAGVLRTS
jgi:hypothetical protein